MLAQAGQRGEQKLMKNFNLIFIPYCKISVEAKADLIIKMIAKQKTHQDAVAILSKVLTDAYEGGIIDIRKALAHSNN